MISGISNFNLSNRFSVVHNHNEHRILPQNPEQSDKTGVTAMATPVSYPFESVIAASRQPPYEVLPEGVSFRFLYGMIT